MKGKTSTKQVKRAARKEAKKSVARSLKDAITQSKGENSKLSGPLGDEKTRKESKHKPPFKNNYSKGHNSGNDNKYKKRDASKPKQVQKQGKTPSKTPYSSGKASKPHFKLVENLKVQWNKIRDRSTPKEVRDGMLQKLTDHMKGNILQITLRHDASRIVQAILQFGNPQQKNFVLDAISSKISEIAKTPYGHFVVLKAINYCVSHADQKKITSGMRGHFVSLGSNVIGSRCVETLLQLYPLSITTPLKAEFYGQKFCVLLPEPPKNLQVLISQSTPEKTSAILDHMRDLVQRFVNKGLLEFAYVHHLIWEYTQELLKQSEQKALLHSNGTLNSSDKNNKNKNNSSGIGNNGTDENTGDGGVKNGDSGKTRLTDLVEQLADAAPKLLSTKPGARVMCTIISHATAKERKRILKSLKGHALESALHSSAYLGLMRLIDVTDDTVNVQKSLLDELISLKKTEKYTASGEMITSGLSAEPPLLSVALHQTGHKILTRLLMPNSKHLEPDDAQLFAAPGEHSKKSALQRRKENLLYMKASLVRMCAHPSYTEQLLRSLSGNKVIEGVIRTFRSAVVVEAVAAVVTRTSWSTTATPLVLELTANDDTAAASSAGGVDNDKNNKNEEEEEDDEEEAGEEEEPAAGFSEDYDEEEEEEEEEDPTANKNNGNNSSAKKAADMHLLPIEEDPLVHAFLKRILLFETSLQTQQESVGYVESRALLAWNSVLNALLQRSHRDSTTAASTSTSTSTSTVQDSSELIDTSLFESSVDNDQPTSTTSSTSVDSKLSASVADRLLHFLLSSVSSETGNRPVYEQWLQHNRSSYILARLCAVPTVFQQLTATDGSVLKTWLNKLELQHLQGQGQETQQWTTGQQQLKTLCESILKDMAPTVADDVHTPAVNKERSMKKQKRLSNAATGSQRKKTR